MKYDKGKAKTIKKKLDNINICIKILTSKARMPFAKLFSTISEKHVEH